MDMDLDMDMGDGDVLLAAVRGIIPHFNSMASRNTEATTRVSFAG